MDKVIKICYDIWSKFDRCFSSVIEELFPKLETFMELQSVLMPEYYLLSSDDQAECTQVLDWLKTLPEPMLKWRLQYGFVRTLPPDRLLLEAKQLIDNGSPCVHVFLHGGEPNLDLQLKRLVPPLLRERLQQRKWINVDKLSDIAQKHLLVRLITPDSGPLLAWHFGRHGHTAPDRHFPPELRQAESDQYEAFAQWVASLTNDDLEVFDDAYGTE